MKVESFKDERPNMPTVCGFIHHAACGSGDALILAHSAADNCNSPLLIVLANAFSASGITVLRCDFSFRHVRPTGRPLPHLAARDQAGLRRAVQLMRERVSKRVYVGGHAYGGRQTSLLAALETSLVGGLFLLLYPLHPPKQPANARTHHFASVRNPVMFVQASKDPFGTPDELRSALDAIPAPTRLVVIENARHELLNYGNIESLSQTVVSEFRSFFEKRQETR